MVKQSKEENAVEFCERVYPEMMVEFKRIQAEDYEIFCKKQKDYGPGNIALGTTLATKEDTLMSLTGLIIRMKPIFLRFSLGFARFFLVFAIFS